MLLRSAALLVLVALTVVGCDSAQETPTNGFFEGTYTLPDGTTGSFRTPGYAGPHYYGGTGTSDGFSIYAYDPSPEPRAVSVSVGFNQRTLYPVPGAYSAQYDDPRRPTLPTSFGMTNVLGLDAQNVIEPTTALVDFPRGDIEIQVVGSTLRGTFSLRGHPFGVPDTVEVRISGRFEMPFEPGTPSPRRHRAPR